MNELIKVDYTSARPTILGRDLHEALEIKTPYTQWFDRMKEYGFAENVDYVLVSHFCETNNPKNPYTTVTDHQLSIDMAKEICMLQRSEIGKKFRQYFIEVEKQWNSPDAVMARALEFAKAQLEKIKSQNVQLTDTIAVQTQQIAELTPKASYYDVVLNCKDLLSATEVAKDYGKSAKWLNAYLHNKKVQFKQGGIWLLYQKYAQCGYTSTKTQTFTGNDGNVHSKVHTYWTQKGRLFIYDLLKTAGIVPLIEQVDRED